MDKEIKNAPICDTCQPCYPNVKIDKIEEGMTGKEVADLLYNNFDKLNKSKANKCVERKVRNIIKGENKVYNETAKNAFINKVFYTWSKKDYNNTIDYVLNNAPSIEVGTTTTLPAGSQATVTYTKDGRDAVLNFGIPKGDKGDQGIKGDSGVQLGDIVLSQELGNGEDVTVSQAGITKEVNNLNNLINAVSQLDVLHIDNATVDGNATSNVFSNRVNIYDDEFEITIDNTSLSTISKNISLAVTTDTDVKYYALRNFTAGSTYKYNIVGAQSCIIYVEKQDLQNEGNLSAKLTSGRLYQLNKNINAEISNIRNEMITEQDVEDKIEENLTISQINNAFELYEIQWFHPVYDIDTGDLQFDTANTQATLYVTYNSQSEKEVIFVGNGKATLNNLIVYHGSEDTTQQLFPPYKINPNDFEDGISYIALVFRSVNGETFDILGNIGKVYADGPNIKINVIEEIQQIKKQLEQKSNPLVLSEGRYYSPIITPNQDNLEIIKSYNNIFNTDSYCIIGSKWHSCTITGFTHNSKEKINIFFYIDSKLLNITNEAQGDYLSTVLIRFKNSNNEDIYYEQFSATYQLTNGWNCIESPVLEEECTSLVFETYNQNTAEYKIVISAINVGRQTKAVLTISHDGIYQQSYDNGIYQLHKQLNIPITIIGASQYDQNNSAVNYCKDLENAGLVEFGVYSQDTRTQLNFESANNYFSNLLNKYKDLSSKDLIVTGCQHNRLSKYVETAGVNNRIKVFRCSCNKRNILLDKEGLRAIHTQSDLVTSDWNNDKNNQAINKAKQYIDELIANGSWGDLMTHQIVKMADIQTSDYNLATTYEYWIEILNYIKQKVDEGKLITTTIGNLYSITNS